MRRALSVLAGLSGALALVMLSLSAHALRASVAAADLARIDLGAFVQLVSAAAALALANASSRAALVAGLMIVGGAAVFAGALYGLALSDVNVIGAIAPIGGILMICGWLVAAFANPRR